MLASSSPPKVSRVRHGPRSRLTTFTPASHNTFAAVAPDAPAPIMQTSARAGFGLDVTIGLPISVGFALGEPWQGAEASGEHFHQRARSRKADDLPTGAISVAAVNR